MIQDSKAPFCFSKFPWAPEREPSYDVNIHEHPPMKQAVLGQAGYILK